VRTATSANPAPTVQDHLLTHQTSLLPQQCLRPTMDRLSEATYRRMERQTQLVTQGPISHLSGLSPAFLARPAHSVRTRPWVGSLVQTTCVQQATLAQRARLPTPTPSSARKASSQPKDSQAAPFALTASTPTRAPLLARPVHLGTSATATVSIPSLAFNLQSAVGATQLTLLVLTATT